MLGTALFIYCILCSHGNPLAVVVGLFSSIIIFGGVTGGHFNPAVSLGVYLAGGKYFANFVYLIMIIIGQLIGACIGMGLAVLSIYEEGAKNGKLIPEDHLPKLCPSAEEKNEFNIKIKGCDNMNGDGF